MRFFYKRIQADITNIFYERIRNEQISEMYSIEN